MSRTGPRATPVATSTPVPVKEADTVGDGNPATDSVPSPVNAAVPAGDGLPDPDSVPSPLRETELVDTGLPVAPSVPSPDSVAAPVGDGLPEADSVPVPDRLTDPVGAGLPEAVSVPSPLKETEPVGDGLPEADNVPVPLKSAVPVNAGGAVKIQPELLPPSVEFAPAYQPAPPVDVERLMDRKSLETVPEALDSVCPAAVMDPTVMSLPDVPLTFHSVEMVVVVPAVNRRVRALVTSEKFRVPKVFAPVMSKPPVEPATVYVNVP